MSICRHSWVAVAQSGKQTSEPPNSEAGDPSIISFADYSQRYASQGLQEKARSTADWSTQHAHIIFVCSLRDDNKQTYMKTEACKLCSRVFLIFLPNIIKINAYNFKLYRLIIGSFFETQCTILQITQQYHRLRGSASPVLTATLHSYGSLARLSDFFSPTALEVRPLNRFSSKMAQSTWIHARMCLLQ